MEKKHMFSNRDLRKLLIPLVVEQILNSLMGTADSIMVSNVGPAAISAVSLVDSINILVIQAFYALAAGGAIICSQYIGQGDHKNAGRSANQLVFVVTVISAAVTAACLAFRVSLCIFLCRQFGFGPMAVWIGMFTDWTIRAVIFTWRFLSGRWMSHKVV